MDIYKWATYWHDLKKQQPSLSSTNPYLIDPEQRKKLVKRSVETSCGVEGIKSMKKFDDLKQRLQLRLVKEKEHRQMKKLDPKTSKLGKEIVDSDALHPDFTELLAKVADVSISKGYVPFNWLHNDSFVKVSALLKASARHFRLAKKGINVNKEVDLDGKEIPIYVNHLVYAAYNNLMAAIIIRDLPEHDDRLFKDGKPKTSVVYAVQLDKIDRSAKECENMSDETLKSLNQGLKDAREGNIGSRCKCGELVMNNQLSCNRPVDISKLQQTIKRLKQESTDFDGESQ